jgi:ATP-dependent helicase HrpA
VAKVSDIYQATLEKQRKDKPIDKNLLNTKWLIEELRVSLFAQNLGTAVPISVKRIINYLKNFS